MRFILLFVIVTVVSASVSASDILNVALNSQWEAYIQKHNKVYAKEEEAVLRLNLASFLVNNLNHDVNFKILFKAMEMGKKFGIH
jgi:hypothetical protein